LDVDAPSFAAFLGDQIPSVKLAYAVANLLRVSRAGQPLILDITEVLVRFAAVFGGFLRLALRCIADHPEMPVKRSAVRAIYDTRERHAELCVSEPELLDELCEKAENCLRPLGEAENFRIFSVCGLLILNALHNASLQFFTGFLIGTAKSAGHRRALHDRFVPALVRALAELLPEVSPDLISQSGSEAATQCGQHRWVSERQLCSWPTFGLRQGPSRHATRRSLPGTRENEAGHRGRVEGADGPRADGGDDPGGGRQGTPGGEEAGQGTWGGHFRVDDTAIWA
jgi:hypothetical protein